jgi:hypothetical protein
MTGQRYGVSSLSCTACAAIVSALAPGLAQAYVGPGVGLSALGSVLAFIGAVFLLIVGFLWYPIKRLLKRGRKSDADATVAGDPGAHKSDED